MHPLSLTVGKRQLTDPSEKNPTEIRISVRLPSILKKMFSHDHQLSLTYNGDRAGGLFHQPRLPRAEGACRTGTGPSLQASPAEVTAPSPGGLSTAPLHPSPSSPNAIRTGPRSAARSAAGAAPVPGSWGLPLQPPSPTARVRTPPPPSRIST